ncbi:MAG: hypothetical protein CSA45_04975 [Gammaproteobacteria bacterium]|nr:MAG: hypothetical protein CSA45_04975 [Gammaproteobacteria bacterium]
MSDNLTNTLNLSPVQRQILDDLGIDAWYLTPLQRPESSEDIQHHAVISDLVDSLQVVSGDARSQTAAVATPQGSPGEALATVDEQNAAADNTDEQSHLPPQATAGSPKKRVVAVKQHEPRREHVIPTVTLDSDRNVAPPAELELAFPDVSEQPGDWSSVRQAAVDLAAAAQLPYCLGEGAQTTADMLILPPPDYPLRTHRKAEGDADPRQVTEKPLFTAAERQLLSEILHSIGRSLSDCYATPLLKLPMRYGLDPDAETLAAHLPLLAAELALSTPKRLFLFGATTCHALLQTAAPLSLLMPKNYTLRYTDYKKNTCQAEVICLPPLDYLLALPAEKSVVWQHIQHLA